MTNQDLMYKTKYDLIDMVEKANILLTDWLSSIKPSDHIAKHQYLCTAEHCFVVESLKFTQEIGGSHHGQTSECGLVKGESAELCVPGDTVPAGAEGNPARED